MKNIKRDIRPMIEKKIFKGKVLILYGARQVGKTTLMKSIFKNHLKNTIYLNCDEPDIREALSNKTSSELKAFFGSAKIVIIDEAQRVKNIGLTLKILTDTFPKVQVIATGSSSFELSNAIIEPLTGRSYEFHLYPFSVHEWTSHVGLLQIKRTLERRLIYGMYPEVVLKEGKEAEETIKNIARSYLYKDILVFQNIKNPESLEKLLQALALQLGNEVSYNELAQLIGVDKNTVAHYIQILEKAFIIFRLSPFSRNIRNELKKLRKIYFYDNGVRNALLNNFNPLHLRNDVGALFENFMISERIKRNAYLGKSCNRYFWRTHQQQEIDYIEESEGELRATEFKWAGQKYKPPKTFLDHYPGAVISCVTRENFNDFLI